MRRFFVAEPLAAEMAITGQDARHISRVLRLSVGEPLIIVAAGGQAGQGRISAMTADAVTVVMEETLSESKEPPICVRLAQSLPKSDKMDYIVQKAVELGVTAITPLAAEHCVVQYDAKKKAARCERWQKIAMEAAKQCGRSSVPAVEPIASLREVLQQAGPDTVIVFFYEGETPLGLKTALADNRQATDFLLIVGPEGGFSPAEVALARAAGAQIVTLGPRILRTETAALAGVAAIMYEQGDLGG